MLPVTGENKLGMVLSLTVLFFAIELVGGIAYNSLALVTDAAFMATNISGQLMAIFALRISGKPKDKEHPFGHARAKVLSALFNGVLVGFVVFYVVFEAYNRLRHPQIVNAGPVLVIALIGLLVNGLGLLALRTRARDIALKGPFLLLLTDTLSSLGVVASAALIRYTGVMQLDAVTGVVIGLLVAYPTYFLVRDSVHILMEGTPIRIDPDEVQRFILEHLPGVRRLKGLRIWGISPEYLVLAVRVRTDGVRSHREAIQALKHELKTRFGFEDVYVELYNEEV